MYLIIAGGRDYELTEDDYLWLDEIPDVTHVIEGGAKGADRGGRLWAIYRGLPYHTEPADWENYGNAAGPRRNRKMAEMADALAVFPGGRGSASMKKIALEMGLKVYERT